MTNSDSSQSRLTARTKRRGAIWALVLLLAAGVAAGIWWQGQQSGATGGEGDAARQAQPSQGAGAPPAPPVTVANPIHKEIVEWDEYPGQFRAVDAIDVRARVSGYLEQIHFTDGQIVRQGDLLFTIEKRPFEIALDAARAQLAEATAQLSLAQRNLKRYEKMREGNIVGEADYDDRVEAVSAGKAAVAAAQAELEQAELDLGYTEIRAPVTGRISRHEVSAGNLITGGYSGNTTLLTTIVSLDPIYFEFDVSEANYLAYQRATERGVMPSMRKGNIEVFAKLPDEDAWRHKGVLGFVDNRVDATSGTIKARATFPNSKGVFIPGQFGHIRVPGSEPYKAILLPESAIVTDQSQKIALVVAEDGTVGVKILRVGPHYDDMRIIREGLEPSDRVVINGLLRARPGSKVTAQMGTIEPGPQAAATE
ncbi:efflux RND transporter periplasmic adaptor subunit [Dongia deserti]|uniref:efflux RND transporter periplasmic adaptor subunit n=1 Tax=Dongia deserti TaxID=2268030 RepID=UPI000E6545C1|nr:efflux RND transporter periplasmic adaptor subunit [Dongia deserti]